MDWKRIDGHINNIKLWRYLHPDHIINLWITPQTLENNDLITLLKTANIKLRYINENQELKNYKYIEHEIIRGNPWSASDILRISILLQEPGYYFDIDVTPKAALPNYYNKEKSLFIIDIKNTIGGNNIAINLAMQASASVNHSVFLHANEIIKSNFDFLKQEKIIVEQFYNLSSSKSEKDYFFAVFVTGKAVATSIASNYLIKNYLKRSSILEIDEIRELIFPYTHLLNIPIAKGVKKDISEYKLFNKILGAHTGLVSNHCNIKNTSLINRLEKFSGLEFFSSLNNEGYVYAFAKIENSEDEKLANKLRNIDSSGKMFLGKNRFFVIPSVNTDESSSKIQSFLKLNKY
jgi:hypothetical protein